MPSPPTISTTIVALLPTIIKITAICLGPVLSPAPLDQPVRSHSSTGRSIGRSPRPSGLPVGRGPIRLWFVPVALLDRQVRSHHSTDRPTGRPAGRSPRPAGRRAGRPVPVLRPIDLPHSSQTTRNETDCAVSSEFESVAGKLAVSATDPSLEARGNWWRDASHYHLPETEVPGMYPDESCHLPRLVGTATRQIKCLYHHPAIVQTTGR